MTKKCYGSLSQLYPIQKVTSIENRKILAQAYILSHINYASVVWLSRCNKKVHCAVNKIIKSTARFVLQRRKFDSITSNICHDLEWLIYPYLYEYNILYLMFKTIIFSKDGDYFYRYLNFDTQLSQSTRAKAYVTPTHRAQSDWGNNSFKFNSVKLWYMTPLSVRQSVKSINMYKKSLYAYFLTKQIDETKKIFDDESDSIAAIFMYQYSLLIIIEF